MSRESKIINVHSNFDTQTEIKHYESFGWELLAINHTQISMTRETQNPVYPDLVKYEYEYESLCNKINELRKQIKYKSFSFKKFMQLFILLIFPSVLYVLDLDKTKKRNKELNEEIAAAMKEIDDVCNKSKAIFFAKQAQ